MDKTTHSIALTDYGIGPGEVNRLEIVDSERGFVRWRREVDGSWLVNADGTLAATADGIAFATTVNLGDVAPLYAMRLSNGQPVWQAPVGSGWEPHLIGELLLLHTDTVVTAFDASTGSQRWQWQSDDSCGDGLDVDYGAAATLAVTCGRTIFRISLDNGAVGSKWSTQDHCVVRSVDAVDEIVGIIVTCGSDEQRLHVLDGKSGAERWHHPISWTPEAADPGDGREGAAYVSVVATGDAPVLEVRGDDGVELYAARNGKRLGFRARRESTSFSGNLAGNLLYRQDTDEATILSAINPRTGSVVWTRGLSLRSLGELGDEYVMWRVEDRLHLVGTVKILWPAVIVLIDGHTGAMSMSAIEWGGGKLVGVEHDGTLYAIFGPHEQRQLTAVRVTGSSKGFLGTSVRGDQWPDACRLLTIAQYRSAYPGSPPLMRPERLNASGLALPVPPRCRYLPHSIKGTEVTVDVSWLSESAGAARLASDKQSHFGTNPMPVVIGAAKHKALRWNNTNPGVDRAMRTRLSFAIGRCVASVETLGDSSQLATLAGIVADNLADPAVSPGCTA